MCPPHILQSSSATSLDDEAEEMSISQAPPINNVEEEISILIHQSISVIIQALCRPMEILLSKLTRHDPKDGFLNSLFKMVNMTVVLSTPCTLATQCHFDIHSELWVPVKMIKLHYSKHHHTHTHTHAPTHTLHSFPTPFHWRHSVSSYQTTSSCSLVISQPRTLFW